MQLIYITCKNLSSKLMSIKLQNAVFAHQIRLYLQKNVKAPKFLEISRMILGKYLNLFNFT